MPASYTRLNLLADDDVDWRTDERGVILLRVGVKDKIDDVVNWCGVPAGSRSIISSTAAPSRL